VKKFFIYYLTLAQATLSGAAIAFAFSALVSVFAVANLLVSLIFILYMVWLHYTPLYLLKFILAALFIIPNDKRTQFLA